MKTMSRLAVLLSTIAATVVMTGCASGYKAPNAQLKSDPVLQARANRHVTLLQEGANAAETVARSASSMCTHKGPRMPFAVYVNPPGQSAEMRSALLSAGLTGQPLIFATHADAKAYDRKEIVAIDADKVALGEHTAYGRVFGKVKEGKPPVLSFSDGTKAPVAVSEGCGGYTLFEVGEKGTINIGVGVEIINTRFLEYSTSKDALLFLMGRSLFYTSGPGANELNKVLMPSALLNGVLSGVTLGLSRAVVDTKEIATNGVRNQYQLEADAFGLRAAVLAGASPEVILHYVEALNKQEAKGEGALPKDLRFDKARVAALKAEVLKLTPAVASR